MAEFFDVSASDLLGLAATVQQARLDTRLKMIEAQPGLYSIPANARNAQATASDATSNSSWSWSAMSNGTKVLLLAGGALLGFLAFKALK